MFKPFFLGFLLLFCSTLISEETLIYSSDHKRIPRLFDREVRQVALIVEPNQLPYEIIWSFKFGKLFSLSKLELNLPFVMETEFVVSINTTEEMNQFQEIQTHSGRLGPRIRLYFKNVPARFIKISFRKPIKLNEVECFGTFISEKSPPLLLPENITWVLSKHPPKFNHPVEKALMLDLEDRVLNDFSLLDCSLIASRIYEKEDRLFYQDLLHRWVLHFSERFPIKKLSHLNLAKLLLRSLHGPNSLMSVYDKGSSDFQNLLELKQYNCVSAVLLYQWMARQLGLKVIIAEGLDHTFGYLHTNGEQYPVEATTKSGFDLRSELSSQEEFRRSRGFAPYSDQSKIRWVSDFEGSAMIYYNTGVEAERSKEFLEAIYAYKLALMVDPEFQAAYQNLLSAYTKWISQQITQKKFKVVLDSFVGFEKIFPHSKALSQYKVLALNSYALELLSEKKYYQALNLFQNGLKNFPNNIYFRVNQDLAFGSLVQGLSFSEAEPLFSQIPQKTLWLKKLRSRLLYQWANEALNTKKYSDAVRFYREILTTKKDARIQQNLLFAFDQWARAELDAGQKLKAIQIYHQIYQETKDPDFQHNRDTLITQTGATFLHEQKFEASIALYSQALKMEPGNSSFQKTLVYSLHQQQNFLFKKQQWLAVEKLIQQIQTLPLAKSKKEDVEEHFVLNYVELLVKKKQFPQAVAFLAPYATKPIFLKQLTYLYYQWAEFYGKQGNYKKACEIYRIGIRHIPSDKNLKKNLKFYEQKIGE